ncbi:hypothetical protein ACIA58_02160 [Kribbella sp. NPDC051586]|uniref:hypothetical protein n=1 Tax=Kribbella sp. NPDC051586 TaxID=3364118 RepID=UPI003797FB30
MNLQDLRDELATRAASTDQHPADLLPGVKHKIRRTKQRRIISAAGTAAAALAIAATAVPGVLNTPAPDPAEHPSYTQNGFTLPGELDGDELLKGWAGHVGENQLSFDWTPASKEISFVSRCKVDSEVLVWVRVNGVTVDTGPCTRDGGPIRNAVPIQSILWNDAPIGRPAKVTVDLVDAEGRAVHDPKQQIGVGIYADESESNNPPDQTRPGDYVLGGLQFRKQVGTQTRLGAVIGDRGAMQVATSFVPTSHAVVVQTVGTPQDYLYNPSEYRVQVRFGDGTTVNGYTSAGDQSQVDTSVPLQLTGPPGRPMRVTARLVDKSGKPVSVPQARIGVAIYDPGPQVRQNGIDFDREKVSDGTKYRFVRSVVVPATQGRVQLTTPVGKPFIWSYGSVGIGAGVWTRWDGLDAHQDGPMSGGFGWHDESPQTEPKTVDFYVNAGKPTGGKLAIALYEPA